MISALLLTALFFRLGVEQRSREIGLLEALGFPPARIKRLFASRASVFRSSESCSDNRSPDLQLVDCLRLEDLVGRRGWNYRAHCSCLARVYSDPMLGRDSSALLCIVVTLKG